MKLFSHVRQRFTLFAPLRAIYDNAEVQQHAEDAFAELDKGKAEKSDTLPNDADMAGKAKGVEDQSRALKKAVDAIRTKPDVAPLAPRLDGLQKRIDGANTKVEGYKGARNVVTAGTLGKLKESGSKIPLQTGAEMPAERPKVREYTEAEKAQIEAVAQQMTTKTWEIPLPDKTNGGNFGIQRDGAVGRGRIQAVNDISKALGLTTNVVNGNVIGFGLKDTRTAENGKITIVAGFRDIDSARATVKSVLSSHPS